jgi:hypothetical protein
VAAFRESATEARKTSSGNAMMHRLFLPATEALSVALTIPAPACGATTTSSTTARPASAIIPGVLAHRRLSASID